MTGQFLFDQRRAIEVRTFPGTKEIGRALEQNRRLPGAMLRLHFGDQVASLGIADLWSACCELLLDAQLIREGRLDHFVLDVEQVFKLSYSGDLLLCTFSREHVFAVSREEFAAALEQAVGRIFASTSCPRLMEIAAGWGASAIRSLPYSSRFSDSLLT